MPAAAGVLSLVGTGVAAASAYQQGQDAKALARNNSILEQEQADQAQKQGVVQQNQYRRQLNQLLGRQRAIIAGNNLQDSGSPLALQEDTASLGEDDIANIRNQAALSAWGYQTGADAALQRADTAARSGTMNAFGTILGGYGKYRAMGY